MTGTGWTVDLFFRTLAAAKGRYAASIVLSGTGTDGSVGMKAIKQEGGLAVVQDPEEAAYPGMPQSAINTGLADVVLPAGNMAGELLAYKENLDQIRISGSDDEGLVQEILKILQGQTGHDFSNYKRSSVRRRIQRRMQVKHTPTLTGYLSVVQQEPGEAQELLKDLLISVTRFFRDPEAFEALANSVIPTLFKGKGPDDQLRIWVPGCATGEEAYSIAMLVREQLRHIKRPPEIKIFASDIDEVALKSGRRGEYPESIAADVKKTYLHRYFDKQDHHYRLTTGHNGDGAVCPTQSASGPALL